MNQSMQSRSGDSAAFPRTVADEAPRRVTSGDLLCGERRVIIQHGDASYTLLLTRNDKLILTK